MASKLITDLHPLFQPVAAKILTVVGNAIYPSAVRIDSGFRTLAEQQALVASGTSHVPISFHNFGLALDVAIIAPNGAYIADGTDPRYRVFGVIAEQNGCVWGGRFHTPDWDHIEFADGEEISNFVAWLKAHSVVLP